MAFERGEAGQHSDEQLALWRGGIAPRIQRRAFEALASLVGQIIDPQANVVPLKDHHVQKT